MSKKITSSRELTKVRADNVKLKYGKAEGPSGDWVTFRKDRDRIALKPSTGLSLKKTYKGFLEMEQFSDFVILERTNASKSIEDPLDKIRMSGEVSIATHLYFMHDANGACCVPNGEIFLRFDEKDRNKVESLIESHELEILEVRSETELIVCLTQASKKNPLKISQMLQQEKAIGVAEPELLFVSQVCEFMLPKDELLQDQWHLKNTGRNGGTSWGLKAEADARVVNAWKRARTLGSHNVIVAVIDDGFDLEHPDLKGVNKIHAPFDFKRNSTSPLPNDFREDHHGTACAGIAIGSANGEGIVGSAPDCKLLPVRMGATLSDKEIELWFGYVKDNGAWVVSCSWKAGSRSYVLSTRKHEAIEKCAQEGREGNGVVICFAAGNESTDIDDKSTFNGFATHPDVLAISASTSKDKRSNYSNFGSKSIAVCAPSGGTGARRIVTSDVTGVFTDRNGNVRSRGYARGAYYKRFSGTSSSCPLVAGICALAFSIKPTLKAYRLIELIKDTARPMAPNVTKVRRKRNTYSKYFGYGCIDAEAIIEELI